MVRRVEVTAFLGKVRGIFSNSSLTSADPIMADALQPANFDPLDGESNLFDDFDLGLITKAEDEMFKEFFSLDDEMQAVIFGIHMQGTQETQEQPSLEELFKGTEDMAREEYLTAAQRHPSRPTTPPLQERLQASEAPRRVGEPPSSRKRKGAFVDQLQKTKGGDDYTLVRERNAPTFNTGIPIRGTKSGIDPDDPEYEIRNRRGTEHNFGIRSFLRKEYNVRPEDFGDPAQQSRLDERGLESLRATQTTPLILTTSAKALAADPHTGLIRDQRLRAMRNRYDGAWD